MTRIATVTNPTGKTKELLEMVKNKLGMVPNMMATLAQSPAALESYLSFSGALAHSSIPKTLQEQIALTVSEANGCGYCVAAHTKLGSLAGLSESELKASRKGHSTDPKEQLALNFAQLLVENRGHVTDGDVEKLRKGGFDDGAIAEIVAVTALNIFTNYFNHVADPVVDFPAV